MANEPEAGWRKFVAEANAATTTGFQPGPITETVAPTPFSAGFPSPPSFDPIERLPEDRKDLFRKLGQRRDDAHRLIPPFEDVREASMARVDAASALKTLVSHPQEFGRGLPHTDPLAVAAQKHLDKMTADFKRLTELQEVRSAAFQTASGALASCEDWLRHGVPGNCNLEAVEVEPPKLAKGEDVLSGIERLRRRVRELKADLHRIASAPFPSSYSKQRLRQMVEQFASRGTPDVSALIEHDGDIVWPTQRVRSEVVGAEQRALAFHEAVDVVGLFAAILKPAMISFLDGLVDAEQDDPAALTHEARQQAEAEAMGDLLSVERDEAALVWQAQTQAQPCEHRADCSPLAILQLRLITAPRAAPPDSSAGHAGFNLVGGRR